MDWLSQQKTTLVLRPAPTKPWRTCGAGTSPRFVSSTALPSRPQHQEPDAIHQGQLLEAPDNILATTSKHADSIIHLIYRPKTPSPTSSLQHQPSIISTIEPPSTTPPVNVANPHRQHPRKLRTPSHPRNARPTKPQPRRRQTPLGIPRPQPHQALSRWRLGWPRRRRHRHPHRRRRRPLPLPPVALPPPRPPSP